MGNEASAKMKPAGLGGLRGIIQAYKNINSVLVPKSQKKKKKDKEAGGGTLRFFMDKFINDKEKKNNPD